MVRAPSLADDVGASYRISLVRSGEGPGATWLAEVDELPNCSARGATPEEAVRRVWAVADGMLGPAQEERGDDQQPRTGARHSGKLLVRMPATLHDELARAAEIEGVSLNQLITGVLASAVEWRSGDEELASRHHAPPRDRMRSLRLTRIALAANFVVVLVAAIVAIALLLIAWRDGF